MLVVDSGGFGQPVAVRINPAGGAFFGLEYPAATSRITMSNTDIFQINSYQDFGAVVGREPVESDWTVEAIVPASNIKKWFFTYLDDVCVVPVKPYTLYNSWYDLRSPEYPGVKPQNVMNEANVMNIIHLFKKNMQDKHDIRLDAFVLDDGWDDYKVTGSCEKKHSPMA